MTTARIDALGVTQVPSAADTSQIADETICPPKAAHVDKPHFVLSILDVHSNLRDRWYGTPATLHNAGRPHLDKDNDWICLLGSNETQTEPTTKNDKRQKRQEVDWLAKRKIYSVIDQV
jgi:hypothetical protein